MSKEITIKGSEATFLALQQSSTELAERCSKLTITDDTTEKIAIQNYSMLKDIIGQIEDVRKREKAPYFEAGKQIDALAKKLSDPLTSVLEQGRGKVAVYNTYKREAERKRVNKIKEFMDTYSKGAIHAISECTTMEELSDCRESWVVSFPGEEIWCEFTPEAEQMKLTLNDYCKNKRIALQTPEQVDEVIEEVIKESIVEQVAEVSNREVAPLKTATKFRGTWKYEVIVIDQVPRQLMMVDDKKVKEFMKENKDSLVDGITLNGIKFFVDENVIIK